MLQLTNAGDRTRDKVWLVLVCQVSQPTTKNHPETAGTPHPPQVSGVQVEPLLERQLPVHHAALKPVNSSTKSLILAFLGQDRGHQQLPSFPEIRD